MRLEKSRVVSTEVQEGDLLADDGRLAEDCGSLRPPSEMISVIVCSVERLSALPALAVASLCKSGAGLVYVRLC